jgi:hypothetical protein
MYSYDGVLCLIFHRIIKFLVEIMALVSAANIMVFAEVFIVGERSFMYIIKNKFSRMDPCGTPCFIVPQFEKKF